MPGSISISNDCNSTLPCFALRGHTSAVNCVEFMPLHDAETNTSPSSTLISQFDGYSFHPNLLSGDSSGSIRIWSLSSRRTVSSIPNAHNDKGILALIALTTNQFISQGRDGLLKQWHIERMSITNTQCINTGSYAFCRCAVNNDLQVIANPTDKQGKITLWDLRSYEPIMSVTLDYEDKKRGMCTSLAFASNHMLVAGSESGHIDRWDMRSISSPRRLSSYQPHEQPVFSIALNDRLSGGISASADNYLKAFQFVPHTETIVECNRIPMPSEGVSRICSRTDNKLFAVCAWDYRVRLFCWKNLRLLATLDYHSDAVYDVSFVPGNTGVFATASKDRRIAVFRLYANTLQQQDTHH